ncbi:3-deoxy-D-manno-octulosonic acid transferase [Legionella israelensis]|uniref:3-deoxy-D-manno-octulosonic acid transferase n=1 Tax=Legionella israelensis TaxID=454 RepID=A0AAX1EEW3_9GAMM|nr:lipid IV(A) 3-deoxy-D-manno-octulosonic acid transferase [Legionella israelensis]QBR83624.1 3-deoxy-D-manno-octulosonic acid transferase [Legionella israelensis]
MRFIYSYLLYLLTPFLFVRLLWKSRQLPAYRKRIGERFMWSTPSTGEVDVWVHAVSLGEVIAVTPLVDAMLRKKWKVLLTTMTPTGSQRVLNQFENKVYHQYLPYDLPAIQRHFFKRYKPRLGIIMETELWPNMIYEAHKMKIPLMLMNARLSRRSMQNYQKAAFFFKKVLNRFIAILTQSEDDALRFIHLGARKNIVHAVGNMKFDLQLSAIIADKYKALQHRWGSERTVVIAASTHDNEEALLLEQLPVLQQSIENVLLLIAPRHPERFRSVYQYSVQQGFNTGLRSESNSLSPQNEVIILDCLGELMVWYQLSHYAFVGGSFVEVGGHNVLEPIAVNVPVFTGPHVHNFKTICKDLMQAEAMIMIDHPEALVNQIIHLHENEVIRIRQIRNASHFLEKNKGSIERYLARIEQVLSR